MWKTKRQKLKNGSTACTHACSHDKQRYQQNIHRRRGASCQCANENDYIYAAKGREATKAVSKPAANHTDCTGRESYEDHELSGCNLAYSILVCNKCWDEAGKTDKTAECYPVQEIEDPYVFFCQHLQVVSRLFLLHLIRRLLCNEPHKDKYNNNRDCK